jgi:hypothetical protein
MLMTIKYFVVANILYGYFSDSIRFLSNISLLELIMGHPIIQVQTCISVLRPLWNIRSFYSTQLIIIIINIIIIIKLCRSSIFWT